MSHRATNWAIQQRGLEPATKLLLWQLADRHNADTGRCDPSQERLADDCEMSRATVNRHLKKLEAAGLIRRIQRLDPRTKRQASTAYLLAFDHDFTESQDETRAVSQMVQEPCLKSDDSRVSDCDTNPVREPGKEPVCGADAARHTHPAFDEFWEAYPRPKDRDGTERAFAQAVADGAEPSAIIAGAKAYAVENDGNELQYLAFPVNWLKAGRWRDHKAISKPVADSGDVAEFWAAQVKGRAFIPSTAISPSLAHRMIEAGLVTPDDLKAAGVAA